MESVNPEKRIEYGHAVRAGFGISIGLDSFARAYGVRGNSKMGLHDFGNMRVPWGFIDLFSYLLTFVL